MKIKLLSGKNMKINSRKEAPRELKVLLVGQPGKKQSEMKSSLTGLDFVEILEVVPGREEALNIVHNQKPNLVLMDHNLPELSGLETLKLIKNQHPNVKVILLASKAEQYLIGQAIQDGASGYIHKSEIPEVMQNCIELIREGSTFFSRKIKKIIFNKLFRPGTSNKLNDKNVLINKANRDV